MDMEEEGNCVGHYIATSLFSNHGKQISAGSMLINNLYADKLKIRNTQVNVKTAI